MNKLQALSVAALIGTMAGANLARAAQVDYFKPTGERVQGEIVGGKLMIVGPDRKPHPAPNGQYRDGAGRVYSVQMGDGSVRPQAQGVPGIAAPGGMTAIGPKPDDPLRSGKAAGGSTAIGPKPDDPARSGMTSIGPKPDDPLLSGKAAGATSIGPKPDDPRSRTPAAAGAGGGPSITGPIVR